MVATATQNGQADEAAKELLGRTERVAELRANDWKLTVDDRGGWVELRDPYLLTEGQRSRFKEAGALAEMLEGKISEAVANGNDLMVAALTERMVSAVMKADRLSIAMFVETWSFQIPVPNVSDTDSLGQLPGPVFDRLSMVSGDLVKEAFLDPRVSSKADSPFSESVDLKKPL